MFSRGKKSELPYNDLYDVTFGSPAIFWKQDTSKEAQRGDIKIRGFPSPSREGFGFMQKKVKLPTDNNRLSGAGHIQFEVVLHKVTSWIEVEWLVGYQLM